jgi:hypothetical protein
MHLIFRILDLDVPRQKKTELNLQGLVRAHEIDADIYLVHDFLEFGRLGVANKLPALEMNGVIVSTGRILTEAMLENICRQWIFLSKIPKQDFT